MKKIDDFILGKIANDFRFHFIRILSIKADENNWRSSMVQATNDKQNAFFFSQRVALDTGRVIEGVYRDIQDTLRILKAYGFEFDVLTVKKGYSIEVTNIRWKN